MRIGFDLVDCQRFAMFGDSILFLSLVFSSKEINECQGNLLSLAGKFSAKEALLKALHLPPPIVTLNQIEILRDSHGRPYLTQTSRKILQINAYQNVLLSISHERNIAGAVCLII